MWLKDLDGRYLRVNRRYVDQLGTDAEHMCGRTDAELTAAESIEGLRLQEEDTALGGNRWSSSTGSARSKSAPRSLFCALPCATARDSRRPLAVWRHRLRRNRWHGQSSSG